MIDDFPAVGGNALYLDQIDIFTLDQHVILIIHLNFVYQKVKNQ